MKTLLTALTLVLSGQTAPPAPTPTPTPTPSQTPTPTPTARPAPKPAAPKPTPPAPKPEAPSACKGPTAAMVTVLDGAVTLLVDHSTKPGALAADAGPLLDAWLNDQRPALTAARAEAAQLQKTLSDVERKLCEDHAADALNKPLGRLVPALAFYLGRPDVLRRLGVLGR